MKISREAFSWLFSLFKKENVSSEVVLKPMANYYSCRLKSPSAGATYRYEKCAGKHEGKCIDHVYQIKGGKSSLQSLRFSKSVWSRGEASSYCSSRDGRFE